MNGMGDQRASGRSLRLLLKLERLAAAGLLVTVLVTMAAQVVARYVFRKPISWSEEWARFALIWLAFMAAAFVMAEGRHIAVDVVSSRLSARGKLWLECISSGFVVGACLVLLVGGFRFVWRVGLVGSPALGIPMSCWYGAASVGLGLMALHSTCGTVAAFRRGRPAWDIPAVGDEEDRLRGGNAS
ncbi:MAG: TRAP transporter small permease [Planctomycetes bacterium]|nr:TRAP transporter small permease [Planctomycetota bacterium]